MQFERTRSNAICVLDATKKKDDDKDDEDRKST